MQTKKIIHLLFISLFSLSLFLADNNLARAATGESFDIFTDDSNLVVLTQKWNGTLTLSTSGAYEGSEHYVFDFDMGTAGWAGARLGLTNWGGNGTGYDFTAYQTLQIALSLTDPADLQLIVMDADASTNADTTITGLSSSYQLVTIPLSDFAMTLDDVGYLDFYIKNTSSTGTLKIDAIRLADPHETEPPSVPQNLTAAVIDGTTINLDWSPSTDNEGIAKYNIYRDGSLLTTSNRSCYSNINLSPETLYSFAVSAVDSAGNESAQSSVITASTPIDPAPGGGQGWLYTQGNKIYKEDGTIFIGRGANIFDTRLNNGGTWIAPNVAEINRRTDEIVDIYGATFLRLVLESYASLQQYQQHGLSVLEDPDYVDDIVEIVEHIGSKKGVYVLVSIWVDPSLEEDTGWPTEQTADEWDVLVEALAEYPYVLFGICNEPKSNSNGSLDSQVWDRMTMVAQSIREKEAELGSPQHIIAVQGTRQWARHLEYYVNHPITVGGGANIVYETHPYNHESEFEQLFLTPSETLPVIIGEFGPSSYSTMEDAQALIDITRERQIPWLAWSFNHDADPSMLVYQGGGSHIGIPLIPTDWGLLIKDNLAPLAGDVDRDLDVDLTDAVLAIQSMAGINPDKASFNGDADEDLKLGISDVIYILGNL